MIQGRVLYMVMTNLFTTSSQEHYGEGRSFIIIKSSIRKHPHDVNTYNITQEQENFRFLDFTRKHVKTKILQTSGT